MGAPKEVSMSFATRSIDDTINMSNHLTREIAMTARRGFRPDEVARMKDRGDWGVPPIRKGETESKSAINARAQSERNAAHQIEAEIEGEP